MPSESNRSLLLLARLHSMPRLVVPVGVLALTIAGLLTPPPIGVPCLLVLAGFFAWLASVAWPKLDPTGRALRVLTIGLLVGTAAARATGAID